MMRNVFILSLFVVIVATTRNLNSRITNGEQVGKLVKDNIVNNGEYPFVVYLKTIKRIKHRTAADRCGASIIRSDAVLTVAHCLTGKKNKHISIYAGLLHTSIPHDAIQIQTASRYVIHENYNASVQPHLNNIGIVFLKHPLKMTIHVGLISLPTTKDYVPGSRATTFGWGKDENGNYPDWLQKTDMGVIENKLCQNLVDKAGAKHLRLHKITNDMMCAMYQSKSTVCLGDFGGPIVYKNKVIGLISFGWGQKWVMATKRTCGEYYPTVFVKVVNYLDWIAKTLILA